jgi:multiple sugar transport system substrate-binding protein
MSDDPLWPENDDRTFDPAEEFTAVGGRRMSRRSLLAASGVAFGAAASGPLIFSKADAEGLFRAASKSNLPYKANTSVKGHVVMWHHYGSPLRHGAIREAIALFNKYYKGVSVSDVGFGFGADWDQMKTRIAAGSGIPDVVVSDRPKLYYDGARHHFYQPITDLVKRDGFKMSVYWPFIQRDSTINKQVYGVGWETDCRVLFHLRATMLDNGLKADVSPKTWNDIETYANKLDQKGGSLNGYSLVTFDPLANYDLTSWAWTNKGDAANSKGQPTINSAKMQQTAAWIKSWLDRYGGFAVDQAIAAHSAGGQADNPMTKKNTVFYVDTPTDQAVWEFYDLRFYTKAGKRIYPFYGAALVPYNTGGSPSNLTGGFGLSMPRKHASAAQRDATWEFMKFMSLVGQKYFAEKVTAVPSVLSMAKNDPILKGTANWATFLKGMQNGHPGIQTKDPAFPGDVLGSDVLNPMWRGDKSIKDTLDAAQQQAITNISKPGQ